MDLRVVAFVTVLLVAGVVGGTGTTTAATSAESCDFPFTDTDTTDTAVTVDRPPERIVVLGASAAQTLWEIGARDRVVGMPVQPYTDYLDGAGDRTPVMNEGGFTVNVEAVVALEPDLVLAPNIIPVDTVERLRSAGLTVHRFEAATSIDDVYEKTALTGRLVGACDGAAVTVAEMDRRIGVVREAVADRPAPRVVYPAGGGFVAGEGTFIDAILTAAGGENIASRANVSGYQQLSPEVVIAQDPEWIVRSSSLPADELTAPGYNRTTAMRTGQVVVVDANLASQPAPRIVQPIETIARALHPDAFAAIDATSTATIERTTGGQPTARTTPGGSSEPTATPGQPGFGLGVALGAVVAAMLLRRRV